MKTLSESKLFGGLQGVYSHYSECCSCEMTFGLFMPERSGSVPLLWFLSGLTCTHENAMTKSGLQAWAARTGLAVIFPDTSPRGDAAADSPDYDLGQGAGFYVNASQQPWARHFRMWDYISSELRELIAANFPISRQAQGITGHSMGGHGALTLAIRNSEKFRSVSAFAPIANPVASDWGRKQFDAYLGDNRENWELHDASVLLKRIGYPGTILIDQGSSDQFLDLLRPHALLDSIGNRSQPAKFNFRAGYDHSYFFISTFAGDHVRHHARVLNAL